MSFYDEHGLLHCIPNEVSENSPLFTAEELLLRKWNKEVVSRRARQAIIDLFDFKEGRWKDRAGEAGYHFSLDNFTGIYTLGKLAETEPWNLKSGLDKQVSTPNWHMHPRDRITWGIAEGKAVYWLAVWLLPILCLDSIIGFSGRIKAAWRKRSIIVLFTHNTYNETSGKIKWVLHWFLIHGKMPRVYLWLLSFQYGKNPLKKLFKIYFPYDNHPINIETRLLFRE